MTQQTAYRVSYTIGWLIFVAALSQWRLLEIPLLMFPISISLGLIMSLSVYSVWGCAVGGSIGLLKQQTWGYPLIYTSLLCMTFGWKMPFIPLVNAWLPEENSAWIMWGLNSLMVTLMAYCHYRVTPKAEIPTP
ncbi:hypothetical protein P3T73_14670 [Kiritimatiellota bacterium B12222]|nr:hypothetical protein P3T73_14670 [Kiritimatiellota bacterium B12222]